MANVLAENGDIRLYGTVGRGFMDADGFTAMDVSKALGGIGRNKPITVKLNSGGGIATEGAAIHAILAAHPGPKTIIVEGVAASAASIIAMAGDDVIMRPGATLMIHDPAGITIGNSAAHGKTVEALETLATNMSEIYAERTGKTPKEMREVMKSETWFTAKEAVDDGFADKVEKGGRRIEAAAFPYTLYQHAPDQLVALATDRNWQLRSDYDEEDDGLPEKEEEKPMTDAEKKAAAETRKSAITNICALAGKPDRAAAFIADEKATTDSVLAAFKKEKDDEEEEAKKAKDEKDGKKETAAEMQARIRAEEQKRCADISAACGLAGKPSKAAAFIAENKSVTDVLAALAADTSAPEKSLSARHAGQSGGEGGVHKDVTASWAKQAEKANARFDATHGRRVGV